MHSARDKSRLDGLVATRWEEANQAVGPLLFGVRLTSAVGDNYPHFKKPRGHAVTFLRNPRVCHLLFSTKMLRAPLHRVDGVVRHELGHVVDMTVPQPQLDRWALTRDTLLPPPEQVERRADAIAEAIWREAILYDKDLVQSTRVGVCPRPAHLGL